MELSEANAPLLNEYKLEYLQRILPQTLFGGLRLRLSFKAPWYTYVLQIILWSIPLLVGCIFTIILELSDSGYTWLFALLDGIVICACHLSLNIILIYFSKKKPEGQATINNNFLMEDDEITFTKCLNLSTFDFVIPKKKFLINAFIHPILSGVVSAFTLMFLQPNKTLQYFGKSNGSIFYCIFGWLVACIALYPLAGQFPKEPNMFSFNNKYELSTITRAFYILILAIIDQFDFILNVHLMIRIMLLTYPFLWLFGLLPSVQVLFEWCSEQILIHLLGGSAMSNDIRLFLSFICSWLAIIISYFIKDILIAVLITSLLAVLLSTDFPTLILSIIKRFHIGSTKFQDFHQNNENNRKKQNLISLRTGILLSFLVLVTGLVVGLTNKFTEDIDKDSFIDILSYIILAFIVISESLVRWQHMFIFFALFKNPLYGRKSKMAEYMKIFLVLLKFILDKIVLPLMLVLFTSVRINDMKKEQQTFINCILIFRNYRMIWQDTSRFKFDVLVYIIGNWCNIDWSLWINSSYLMKMFILSMAVYWIKLFCKKLWFVLLLTYSSKVVEGNQRKVNYSIFLSLMTMPLLIAIIAASTILSSPLLPLFTLPVFIIGFPRPLRMWPDADSPGRSSSSDWIYYQQLTPALQQMLRKDLNYGALSNCSPGEHLLIRFQDRLVWISVLERGLFYHQVIAKGLELQETSCHTNEAESIDDVLAPQHSNFNRNFMHTLTPITQAKLNVYSDAKNVLTGIIDNPTFLENISVMFPKILLCISIKCFEERCKLGMDDSDSLQLNSSDVFHYNHDVAGNDLSTVISDSPFPIFSASSRSNNFESIVTVETNFTTPPGHPDKQESDSDDEFGDFGFGDDDVGDEGESEFDDNRDATHSSLYNEETTKQKYFIETKENKTIDPPPSWIHAAPYGESAISMVDSAFSVDFFLEVVDLICTHDAPLEEIKRDIQLIQAYRTFILNCFYLTEKADPDISGGITEKSRHCYRMFHEKIPWSPRVGWIENNSLLKDMIIKSYRIAFKMVYDSMVLGLDDIDTEEMIEMLTEYEEDWYIGLEENEEWFNAVLKEIPNLFTIGRNEKEGVYISRLVSLQDLSLSIGSLDTESVRGLWSALTLELFYMTNDDEERYSIQAMPNMLRNIVTQAADPPLGYPVYSSGLLNIPFCF